MAKWTASFQKLTPIAVADAANFTSGGYFALQGGSASQVIKIKEVKITGQEPTTSSPTPLILARDSTVGATLSGGFLAPNDPATANLAAMFVQHHTATTKPQRSATLQLADAGLNAFGGILRLVQPEGFEWGMLGNAASNGEVSISCMTGGTPGPVSGHIAFEPM